MKLLNEIFMIRLPDGSKDVFARVAEEFKVRPSAYMRQAVLDRLVADGILEIGKKLHQKLNPVRARKS
jgi:hypothetical protein